MYPKKFLFSNFFKCRTTKLKYHILLAMGFPANISQISTDENARMSVAKPQYLSKPAYHSVYLHDNTAFYIRLSQNRFAVFNVRAWFLRLVEYGVHFRKNWSCVFFTKVWTICVFFTPVSNYTFISFAWTHSNPFSWTSATCTHSAFGFKF